MAQVVERLLPSVVVAVMSAVPTFTAVRVPSSAIDTQSGLLEDRFTFLFVVLAGNILIAKAADCPTSILTVFSLKLIDSAVIIGSET